ncbi:fibrillin-1-like [Dendronephthya gigantea]|uniref:fibrillin-1-like n=1 Tax=Dendronephthya gigantea TaxID=151771 RepID=UPI00106D6085|nr:fibrillin-1-like [Dendronephthya gigantea]
MIILNLKGLITTEITTKCAVSPNNDSGICESTLITDGTDQTLHDSITGIGTHLVLDTVNKTVYWVLFTSDSNYKILKTTYDGQTSQIGTDQSGGITTVDIADGNGYYYVLDSTTSQIFKYDKSTDTMAAKISLSTEATRIVIAADVNECLDDPCDRKANCTNIVGSYICECRNGYEGNGINCTDVNECTGENYCSSNAACENNIGSYECTCNEGYIGSGTECDDIDECTGPSQRCTGAGQSCTNFPGAYRCHCISPRQQIIDGACFDIQASIEGQFRIINLKYDSSYDNQQSRKYYDFTQELIIQLTNLYTRTEKLRFIFQEIIILRLFPGSVGFDYLATFNDTKGINNENVREELASSFNVTGSGTFLGKNLQISKSTNITQVKSLFTVKDYDECNPQNKIHTPDCGFNATCINTDTSYDCVCHSGFEKNHTGCMDIDECDRRTHNCHKNAICINYHGSFKCFCKTGYHRNGTNCQDKNECVHEDHNCHDNATCINNDGSFHCICDSGFTGNGTHCKDVDECSESESVCHGSATCTNIIGSFHCACNLGYRGNGSYCEDIDECAEGNHNCHSNATCTDNDGSFNCICSIGFTGNGTYCKDVDECLEYSGSCHSAATCGNIIGSFQCTCNSGYTGNGKFCEDINECSDPPTKCTIKGQTCINYPGAYKCRCTSPKEQFVNDKCVDIAASIQGRMRIINRNFILAYNDLTSLEFFEFEKEFIEELTRVFMRTSTLRFTFQGAFVTRIFNGSVGIDYVAGFNNATGLSSEKLRQEMSKALNISNSGAFLGSVLKISEMTTLAQLEPQIAELFTFKDYDECSLANIHVPVCGNNTRCINTNTSYYCACVEGFFRKNGTDCLSSFNTVKKDDVNVVRNLMIVVLVWICVCLTTAVILTFIAGYCMRCSKKHQMQFKTELNFTPDTVTSPVYRTRPVMENYYEDNE